MGSGPGFGHELLGLGKGAWAVALGLGSGPGFGQGLLGVGSGSCQQPGGSQAAAPEC